MSETYEEYQQRVIDAFCKILREKAKNPETFDDEYARRQAAAWDFRKEFDAGEDAAQVAQDQYEAMT